MTHSVPHLTRSLSRTRDRADLVTDDAAELRAQLQAVTGERIAALEGIGEMEREDPARSAAKVPEGGAPAPMDREVPAVERERAAGPDLGLRGRGAVVAAGAAPKPRPRVESRTGGVES